ncbi:MAG: acetolactate synthase large subunit [Thermodesulfobacteriota bacterium]
MNGAELFVQSLLNEGIEVIFGIPGEENLAFLEAIRNSPIRLVLTRHEQAAGFMAATYGRLTGKPGVCLSTLGPGATNLVTAVSYALLGGMPSLYITGQKPIRKSKQGRFQIINVVRMMEPLTKYTRQIVSADTIPAIVRDAFRIAVMEKPGPVHIELPEDIAADTTSSRPIAVTNCTPPVAASTAIEEAASLIDSAEAPLILLGAATKRRTTCKAVYDFVENNGLYFFTTQMGKGVIDEHSHFCLGTAALSEHDYLHCAIDRADLIVNIGHDVTEKPPFFMNKGSRKVIHVNCQAADIDEVYFPQHEVIGDITHSITRLSSLLAESPNKEYDYFRRIHHEVKTQVFSEYGHEDFPDTPQRIVSVVHNQVKKNSILSLDNGMYKIWFGRNYKAAHANSLLLDNALATMGAGFPVAIAAKLLYPDRQVIGICGDGGFMMNSQELETAVRLKLDLIIIILRDDGYGMIKWKQAGMGFADFGLDFNNPDFIQYANSYGATGHRVEGSGQFSAILSECLSQSGVHLIEVPVDYSENEKVFLRELQTKTCLL